MSNRKRPNNPALARRQRSRRQGLIAVVVAVVVAVIGAVIAVLAATGGSPGTPTAAATSTPPATTGPTTPAAVKSTGASKLHCSKPPPLPKSPQSFRHAPSPSLAQDATWDATIRTTCGDISLQLDGKKAPKAVSSFLFLAGKGFWTDSPCHRVTTAASGIFVLQCGDPTGTGTGGPGYTFGVENAPKNGNYPAGTLAMARTSDPNSNGSQFFIVYKDTKLPTAGGGYTIFGRVAKGLDIVRGIAAKGTAGPGGSGEPNQPISILGVSTKHA
ncbi:MAG TPA: peptidylprolyl isomerase [Nocardioidaceae bacterium]|nr:peptidylprolyl isomerase [Nocardioidaceae bacterium]